LPFLPLIAGLWVAAAWAAGAGLLQPRSMATLILVALLVVQFRLWDDLEDADRDRRAYPERLVVRGPRARFWRLWAALSGSTAAAAAAIGGVRLLVAVGLLDVLLLIGYRAIRPHLPDVIWRLPLLLSKYPAFVLIAVWAMDAGTSTAPRVTVAAAGAWILVLSYEALHAPAQPAGAVQ
jgi:hypothetical protein